MSSDKKVDKTEDLWKGRSVIQKIFKVSYGPINRVFLFSGRREAKGFPIRAEGKTIPVARSCWSILSHRETLKGLRSGFKNLFESISLSLLIESLNRLGFSQIQRVINFWSKNFKESHKFTLKTPKVDYLNLTGNEREVNNPDSSPAPKGWQINQSRACQINKEISKRAGFNKRIYPHLLRYSDAIERLRQTGNPKALQIHLGHSSITMTMRYLSILTQEDAIRINKEVRFDD